MVHTEDTFSVYVLKNKTNGKIYVGCTRVPVKTRCRYGNGYTHNRALDADFKEYGWDGFSLDIVSENLDYESASSLEADLIVKYDSANPAFGYNVKKDKGAGLCGYKSKGTHDSWNLGMKHSDETKARMSESHKGIKQSPEWVAKRMESFKKHEMSEERHEYLKERCRFLSEQNKKRCRAIDIKTGAVKEYDCIKDAQNDLGCTALAHAIKNGFVRKGHRFEYV